MKRSTISAFLFSLAMKESLDPVGDPVDDPAARGLSHPSSIFDFISILIIVGVDLLKHLACLLRVLLTAKGNLATHCGVMNAPLSAYE